MSLLAALRLIRRRKVLPEEAKDQADEELQLSWEDVGYIRIPLHGKNGVGLYALVDADYDGEYLSSFRWKLINGHVARISTITHDGRGKGLVYLHHVVCKAGPGEWVQHINGDRLDCRSVNLRSVRPSVIQEARRQKTDPNRARRYRGVVAEASGKYRVVFRAQRLATFSDEIEAARAYDRVASAHFGPRAVLNFPGETVDSVRTQADIRPQNDQSRTHRPS